MTHSLGPGAPEDLAEEERRRALRSALEVADLTLDQLWTRYFALGGHADLFEVEGHLQGLLSLPPAEVNVLAHALNERLDELVTQRRVPVGLPQRPARRQRHLRPGAGDRRGRGGQLPRQRVRHRGACRARRP